MKKLLGLIILILISWTAFSQTGINNTDVKCFPIGVVKKITQDLLRGDSAKQQLILTERQVFELEKKILLKDSIIFTLDNKQKNFVHSMNLQNEKYNSLQEYTNKVELRLDKIQNRNKITTYTSCILFGIILSIILTK